MKTIFLSVFILINLSIFFSCQSSGSKEFKIDYEKYVLSNGLEVILHQDKSDPIVAVATLVHVGSNREKPGKTGFAHFFEHMSFNDSENVPPGSNRKLIPELGGSRNGGTWSDGTIYYEVVPKDAFEKILWIDSDRLGFMINTVTEEALEAEKQVVKNEKRQRTDNAAYGHTNAVIRSNLYPKDHPYNWTVIGSLQDLQSATLEDVKEFYNEFYGASNATLVIAGDIDIPKTKKLVEQWFGEIRAGNSIEPLNAMPVTLNESKSLYYEDNFATLPELRIIFPSVESYHDDSYALDVLAQILSGSKNAPLYVSVVEQAKLAPGVSVNQSSDELAGEFVLRVRANASTDLDSVKSALDAGFRSFEKDEFSDDELKRIKAQIETDLYNGVETVLDKAFQLSFYNEYAADPGYISVEAKKMQAVSRQDVIKVYNKYIKNKNYVMTSFVPKGQTNLSIAEAVLAEVQEEKIQKNVENEQVTRGSEAVYEKTKTKHDRSEPDLGEPPLFKSPKIWSDVTKNNINVLAIETSEVPLISFDITLRGGHWLDPLEKAGVANLLTDLLMEGTKNKTPKELEQEIGLLGASIEVYSNNEEIRIAANTLARNFSATLNLVEEILLEPRWDEKEYERLKQKNETSLEGRKARPTAISSVVFNRLLYGDDHVLGLPGSGTLESVKNITLDDLKEYYNKNFSPDVASIHIVGDVNQSQVMESLNNFGANWQSKTVDFPKYELSTKDISGKVFFVNVANSKQSVLRMGHLALSAKDDNYNNVGYANQIIGGGASGRLFQLLRIEKGYTYGAYSFLGNSLEIAPFTAYSSVRSNVTLESVKLMRILFKNYQKNFADEEMEITKNKVIKSSTRSFESMSAKLSLLRNISKFNKPMDYVEAGQKELLEMSLNDFHGVINEYLDEEKMFYLIVGDAQTQAKELTKLGYGKVIMLDIKGNKI